MGIDVRCPDCGEVVQAEGAHSHARHKHNDPERSLAHFEPVEDGPGEVGDRAGEDDHDPSAELGELDEPVDQEDVDGEDDGGDPAGPVEPSVSEGEGDGATMLDGDGPSLAAEEQEAGGGSVLVWLVLLGVVVFLGVGSGALNSSQNQQGPVVGTGRL